LFVLDSCFSGLAGQQPKGSVYLKDLLLKGHFLLTAGAAGQPAYGGKEWGGSLFTEYFLRGAAGAADASSAEASKDGIVSLSELYIYIRRGLAEESERVKGIHQTPLRTDLGNNSEGEFFFLTQDGQVTPRFNRNAPDSSRAGTEAKGAGKQPTDADQAAPIEEPSTDGHTLGRSPDLEQSSLGSPSKKFLEVIRENNEIDWPKHRKSVAGIQKYLCAKGRLHAPEAIADLSRFISANGVGEGSLAVVVYEKIALLDNQWAFQSYLDRYPASPKSAEAQQALDDAAASTSITCDQSKL
jgi:hypothetical protein